MRIKRDKIKEKKKSDIKVDGSEEIKKVKGR